MAVRDSKIVRRVRRWPRALLVTVGILIVVLAAARASLPYIVRRAVNHRLTTVPGYSGQVDQIHIHLWRGAYSLHGIGIYQDSGKIRTPFFLAKSIDFSIAWRELIHRKIVSDIVIDGAKLTFVKGPTKETSQTDADRRWQDVVKHLFPINVTYFELKDGVVRYVDNARQPPADVFVKKMHVVATGLQNRPAEGGGEFPAQINLDGETLGGGIVTLALAAEPLAKEPHFHLSMKVQKVNLPSLNESLRAYAKVDVGRGTFEMAAEMAGRDGGFQGYVKPFFENLDFKNLEDKDKPLSSRLWEKTVAGAAWLVKNKPRDQVGTRIPFEGRFGDAKAGLLVTVANTFRHGFVRAFNPTIENTVHPDNIMPNGKSAEGKDVADVKADPPVQNAASPRKGGVAAGGPTGRDSKPPPAKQN